MERKFEVFGKVFDKKMTPRTHEIVAEGIERYGEEGLKPVEGEIEKTPEELKVIGWFNSCLNEEFRELGVERKAAVAPERIHLLESGAFKKRFPEIKAGALYDTFNDAVYIDKESRKKGIRLYKTIYHEGVHLSALQKYHVEISRDKEKMKMEAYRSGYRIANPEEPKGHQHFFGLNEAMTDYIALRLMARHMEDFFKEFKLTEKELKEGISYEEDYLTILSAIIKKIAENNNEESEKVWKRFRKGYFTGEMMHLRDVDKVFGKGALRVLAALKCGVNDLPDGEITRKVYRYFKTDDEKEREEIAGEILIQRERKKYFKNKNGRGQL